jgi:hypothetical protein
MRGKHRLFLQFAWRVQAVRVSATARMHAGVVAGAVAGTVAGPGKKSGGVVDS